MTSIFLAWLTGEGIVFYRNWKAGGQLPVPGALAATTGLFAALAVLAEVGQLRFACTAAAWGFDIAAFLNLPVATTLAGGGTAGGGGGIAERAA